MMNPQIFVANLAAYNNGEIVGEWIDANQDPADLWECVETILNQYHENEEYIILDYQDFGTVEISEYESIDNVAKLAECLVEYGEAFAVFYQNYCCDLESAVDNFEDSYYAAFSNVDEFVEDYLENMTCSETMNAPFMYSNVMSYIDTEKVKRELEISYTICEEDHVVYVFFN